MELNFGTKLSDAKKKEAWVYAQQWIDAGRIPAQQDIISRIIVTEPDLTVTDPTSFSDVP